MDKNFWISIAQNDYAIPEGYTLDDLTEILFSYLGSTDPELRDDIAYMVYANWLKREMYSGEAIQSHVERLLSNLDKGIGETESDTVFLRTFSILFLAEIVHNDNKKPILEKEQAGEILAKGLWYLEAEQDPRGYIQVKGWAHALAHTADLLLVLSRNRNMDAADLWKMLTAVSNKIVHSTNTVYIHGEDERLASAILEIFRRDILLLERLEVWMQTFTAPDGGDWKGAYLDQERARAFQNTRNLLRSMDLALTAQSNDFPHREELIGLVFGALQKLRPY